MTASWLSSDTTVFDTIEAVKNEAASRGYFWVAINGTGAVYAGDRKPEMHQNYNLWVWLFDIQADRMGWYDLDDKDWRDCRYEI